MDETGTGTVNVKCHRCGFSGYGKAGTKAKRLLEARIVPDPDDDTQPARPAATTPAAPAAPAPAPKAAGLLIGG